MSPGSTSVDTRVVGGTRIIRLPAVQRGHLVVPSWPTVSDIGHLRGAADPLRVVGPTAEGSYLLARPVVDRATLSPTDKMQIMVVPALEATLLLEPRPHETLRRLMGLKTQDVVDFVDAVGAALADAHATTELAALLADTSHVADGAHQAFLAALPSLFDGEAARRMIGRTLAPPSGPRLPTDEWVEVQEDLVAGSIVRLASSAGMVLQAVERPTLRAVPTRQLHITAGNAPMVPVASLLWGWCARGACVVKPAAAVSAVVAALGAALHDVDPSHPLSAATTLAYWRGGDRRVEDVLFAPEAFDRRIVWGSTATIGSVLARGGQTDTIVLRPRLGMSLIGRSLLCRPVAAAELAAVDSLTADQSGCMSSLLHLVEGDDEDVDEYCRVLVEVLARWDRILPQRPSPQAQAQLVALRRGPLASARWFINGSWPGPSSSVARYDGYFDLSRHPGSRLVVVMGSPDLQLLLGRVGPAVSTVGVAPEPLREQVRDDLASRGVDSIVALGSAECGYPGRPHDGLMVLPRLVRWVNA